MDVIQILVSLFLISIGLRVLLFALRVAPILLHTVWDVIRIAGSAILCVGILTVKGVKCISQALANSAPANAYREYRYNKTFERVAAHYFDE